MGFLTPWFLAGGLAIGLPVWLHLLRKHKTTPLPFSSLMFFEQRTLNAGIDAIAASDARTSYAELSRSLRSIATSLKLPLGVELYSDMQQSGWPSNFNDLRLGADVQLHPHGIEAKEMPNFTVE